jgi:hypothetical protein
MPHDRAESRKREAARDWTRRSMQCEGWRPNPYSLSQAMRELAISRTVWFSTKPFSKGDNTLLKRTGVYFLGQDNS